VQPAAWQSLQMVVPVSAFQAYTLSLSVTATNMLQGFGQLLRAGVAEICETYSGCASIWLVCELGPCSTISGDQVGCFSDTVPPLMHVEVSMLSLALYP